MKRVVFFFESVYPDNNAGSIRAHFLIEAFKTAVPNVELIVLTGTCFPGEVNGVKFVSLANPKSYQKTGFLKRALKEIKLGFIAVRALNKIKGDCGFFYISSPSYLASMVLTTYASLSKKRFVFEVRDIYPQAFAYAGAVKQNGLIYKFFTSLSNLAYRKAALNISATEGIAQMIKQNVPESKNYVSMNGFPSPLLRVSSQKYQRFTLVFHGTLGLFQDIELLCDLAEELKSYDDVDLIVIGHGTKSTLVEKATKQNPNFRFLGSLNHEDTINVVSKCHVGLSFRFDDPLSFMSFPVKNWEYVGLAIPSIITPHGSEAGRFLAENGCGIQVHEKSINNIVDEVLKLKSDKVYYQSFVENCKHIRTSFTRELLSNGLVQKLINDLNVNSVET